MRLLANVRSLSKPSRKSLRILRYAPVVAATACWLGLPTAPARATTGYSLRGQFSTSAGIDAQGAAVDQSSNDVYVATPLSRVSESFRHGAVERFSGAGALLNSFAIPELPASEFPEFSGVAVNPSNHDVYAYDDKGQLIDAFNAAGEPVDVFEGGTSSSLQVTGGSEVAVQIASDTSGRLYYPNEALGQVQQFEPDGTPGPVTITGLMSPTDVAVSSTRIYVVDIDEATGSRQVQQFDSFGDAVGTGALGSGVLSNPTVVTADGSGDLFVVDSTTGGIVVDEFDSTGSLIRTLGAGVISSATGIAVNSSSGEIYLVESPQFLSHGPVLIFGPSSVTVPTAVTEAALGADPADEVVTGTANAQGTRTKEHFDYGATTGYGLVSPVPDVDIGSSSEGVKVAAELTGLEPNQDYHYRIVATNAEGDRVYGGDHQFTTQAAAPEVTGEAAVGLTQTGGTLEAQINPNNEATHYYFRYGTSPTLSGATTLPSPPGPEIGASFGAQAVSQEIGEGLSPNTSYYFQVIAANAAGTTEGPIEHFVTLPPAPTAATQPASSVMQTSAILNGVLDTKDAETAYRFEYVDEADFLRTGYERAIRAPQPEVRLEPGLGSESVSVAVTGLQPATAYRFRLIATNAGGVTEGGEQGFTTVVARPVVATGLPVSIGSTAATVNGGVNPEQGETTYHFEYVDEAEFLSTGYQNALSAPQPEGDAGSGAEAKIVTATLSGLSPLTVYHYRLVAINAGGTTDGEDESLTTLAEGTQQSVGGSPFGVGASMPLAGTVTPVLAGLVPQSPPAAPTISPARTKRHLTKAKRLANALRACKGKPKRQRRACERQARTRYGVERRASKRGKRSDPTT